MKNNLKKWSSVLLLSVILFACNSAKNDKKVSATKVDGKNRIEILDFYGDHRCTTCINIEKNTRFTLDAAFKDEIKNGILVFKTINFDDPKNDKIVTEYSAYGTSLFFNVIKDGKEEHIDLSDFAYQLGDDQEKYSAQLKQKIKAELAKL